MYFWRNVITTFGFFIIRLAVALSAVLSYFLVAAGIQYGFVQLLGESTYNYIVSGLVSLLLGIVVCERVGALLLMFVRGWHVAALAYAPKIRKSHAPAVLVGINAFNKNLVGFGAVYGVKTVAKNLLSEFKGKLWDLLNGGTVVDALQKFSENPIVEHLAGDVLDYGFDATMFYLVKHPPEDASDAMTVVVEGIRKYLYCIPSVLITSVGSYILFSVIPRILKWLAIVSVFVTQGITAGILLTVLMWPIFYILDQGLFKPLTMVMFISCYAKRCDKEVDTESKVVRFVDSILDGTGIGVGSDDLGDSEPEPAPVKPTKKPKAEESQRMDTASEDDLNIDVKPDMDDDIEPPPSHSILEESARKQSESAAWNTGHDDEDEDNGLRRHRRPSGNNSKEDVPAWLRNSQPEGDLEDMPLLDHDEYNSGSLPRNSSNGGGGAQNLQDLAAMLQSLGPVGRVKDDDDGDDDNPMSGGMF